MSDFDTLLYPPGIKPSETAKHDGKRLYQMAPITNQQILITNEHKYSLTEELYNLFSNRNATNSLREGLRSFMEIIEASKTDDNTIRLKLLENCEEYIQALEERYDGPAFPKLTPEQLDLVFNPQKRDNFYRGGNQNYYQNNRNENGRYYQPRYIGNGARFISRNNRNDGSQYHQHQQQQYFGRYDGHQSSSYDQRPYQRGNNWNNGGGGYNNYQNRYSQNPNYQRPFNPPCYNMNINYNNNPNNRYSQGPMAAFIDEQKKKKEENRKRMQTQMKLLLEEYEKQKNDHVEERKRIIGCINDKCEEKLDILLKKYYDKLEKIEDRAIAENEAIIKAFQELKVSKE
uniref:Uncharacterized protein n=1 Tax=Panagrolaimus sp. ES5 TaxID=591445 RepID=A0AC34EZH3_9BILA